MTHDDANPCADGERLASSIRDLAAQARRVLSGPPGHGDALALSTRIADLQDQLADRPTSLLLDWLENLRDRVESHHRAGATPSPSAGAHAPRVREVLSPACPGR